MDGGGHDVEDSFAGADRFLSCPLLLNYFTVHPLKYQ